MSERKTGQGYQAKQVFTEQHEGTVKCGSCLTRLEVTIPPDDPQRTPWEDAPLLQIARCHRHPDVRPMFIYWTTWES